MLPCNQVKRISAPSQHSSHRKPRAWLAHGDSPDGFGDGPADADGLDTGVDECRLNRFLFVFRRCDEQSARGLGITEEQNLFFAEPAAVVGIRSDEQPVGAAAAWHSPLRHGDQRIGQDGNAVKFKDQPDPAGSGQFQGMAHEAKAGDIGAGVHAYAVADRRRIPVQAGHHLANAALHLCRAQAGLESGGDGAGADRLGQIEQIAGAGAGVGDHIFGMNQAGDCQAVLELVVADRVAADDQGAASAHLSWPP